VINTQSRLCLSVNIMGLAIGAISLLFPIAVTAQVVLDDTLGNERSQVSQVRLIYFTVLRNLTSERENP
jgi:hypothetical protein